MGQLQLPNLLQTRGGQHASGMGATILNNARIGQNSIIGANALVTEGKEFPDSSLVVGAPANVVHTLEATAEEQLKASARTYVNNLKRFRDEFTPR